MHYMPKMEAHHWEWKMSYKHERKRSFQQYTHLLYIISTQNYLLLVGNMAEVHDGACIVVQS